MKTKNRCLNFLKGIACIGVVFIHIPFPDVFGEIVVKIARFAVPLFFMISGYYLWDYDREVMLKRIRSKIKKLIKLTLVSFFIYAMYALVFDREMYNVDFIRVILIALVINDTSNIFCAWQLWYLIASIYTYIVIFAALKWNRFTLLKAAVPILLVARIMLGFSDTYALIFYQSYLFAGIPYVLIGMYLSKKNIKDIKNNQQRINVRLIVTGIAGFLFSLVGIMDIPFGEIGEIGTIVYAVSIFIFGICNSELVINKAITYIGEKLSLFVYVMHVCVGGIIDNVVLENCSWVGIEYLWVRPVLTLLITLILAATFVRCKDLVHY